MSLCIGRTLFYINTITKQSAGVLSPPMIRFSRLSLVIFLVWLVLFWRQSRHGLNVEEYLTDVLARSPSIKISRVHELLAGLSKSVLVFDFGRAMLRVTVSP